MITVAQLITHLKTLPQDSIVEVGCEVDGHYDHWMEFRPVDTDLTDDLTDDLNGVIRLCSK